MSRQLNPDPLSCHDDDLEDHQAEASTANLDAGGKDDPKPATQRLSETFGSCLLQLGWIPIIVAAVAAAYPLTIHAAWSGSPLPYSWADAGSSLPPPRPPAPGGCRRQRTTASPGASCSEDSSAMPAACFLFIDASAWLWGRADADTDGKSRYQSHTSEPAAGIIPVRHSGRVRPERDCADTDCTIKVVRRVAFEVGPGTRAPKRL